ncbi:MAG: helix-hairpin-helix domain-containing protein, partial [Chloroflexi bacterium]|nr:helix-hairpin-helix domain-containing protein [Chloroflexota bacterium]
ADIETLKRLVGIGDAKAQAIISYREANGPFSSVEELLDVRGIGPATLDAFRDMIEAR